MQPRPTNYVTAVDAMLAAGEIKSSPSTHDSRIIPVKAVKPKAIVGEVVFRIFANGDIETLGAVPSSPKILQALRLAVQGFLFKLRPVGRFSDKDALPPHLLQYLIG